MLKIISATYLIIVIILSLMPASGIETPGYSDKIAHFIAYAAMGILAYFVARPFKNRLYLFLAILALGVLLEFLQIYIPSRGFSYLDILANASGSVFGFGLAWMIRTSAEMPRFGGCGSPHTTVPVKPGEEQEPG